MSDWEVELTPAPKTVKVYLDTATGTWGAAVDLVVFEVDGETLDALDNMDTIQRLDLSHMRDATNPCESATL